MTAYELVWSPGWNREVVLGTGLDAMLRRLRALSKRNPSHTWHEAPRLRAYDRAPSVAHRTLHRLVALGVVAIQASLGCQGGIRFTFGVAQWKFNVPRVGQLRRFTRNIPPGQQSFMPPEDSEEGDLDPPPMPAPSGLPSTVPAPLPNPFSVPERVPTPQASTTRLPEPPGYVAPRKSFDELMRENGFDKIVFSRPWTRGGR